MRFGNQKVLSAIVGVTLLLFPLVSFTTGPLRISFGLLLVIFFPGYTLLSALFPRRNDLGGIERIALSLGVSIAVVPLIGLILNYTPFGIRLYPVLISVTLFIIGTSAIGYYRQCKMPESDQLRFAFSVCPSEWLEMTKLNKTLFISLVVAILATAGSLGYMVAMPKEREKFTEFYILDSEGKSKNYPREALVGQPAYLTLAVVNHEHQPTSYRVEIRLKDEIINHVTTGTILHDQKWEEVINFAPRTPGEKQKVEFYLYKNDEIKPYFKEPLHLYIDVR